MDDFTRSQTFTRAFNEAARADSALLDALIAVKGMKGSRPGRRSKVEQELVDAIEATRALTRAALNAFHADPDSMYRLDTPEGSLMHQRAVERASRSV